MNKYKTVVFAVVVAAAVTLLTIGCGGGSGDYSSPDEKAAERTCQANQRTVDGAVRSYQAMDPDQKYPSSLADMTASETWVLKEIPTCPSGGTYTYDTSVTPPILSCSIHPPLD